MTNSHWTPAAHDCEQSCIHKMVNGADSLSTSSGSASSGNIVAGHSHGFCGNRREWYWLLITAALILAPLILLGSFTMVGFLALLGAKWLWIPLVVLLAGVTILAVVTSLRNPGVMPRDTAPLHAIPLIRDRSTFEELVYDDGYKDHLTGKAIYKVIPGKDLADCPKEFQPYCHTCHCFRPHRTSHCRQCDHCVRGFDHHCIWLANCIGERNYGPFFAFVLAVWLLNALVFGYCIFYYVKVDVRAGVSRLVVTVLVSAYNLVMGALLSFLVFYHLNLIRRNMTTAEHIKAVNDRRRVKEQNKCMLLLAKAFCPSKSRKKREPPQSQVV
jgi:energy-coupling factor transporter transmembrane protein EcfT